MPILHFVYKHTETIIGVLLALLLLTGLIHAFRSGGDAEESGGSSSVDIDAFEKTLTRVLSQAQAVVAGADAGSASGVTILKADAPAASGEATTSPAGGDPEAAARLQALVAEREKKIAELQAALEKAQSAVAETGAAAAVDPTPEFQEKIRELEARLAEYAIIEDDIADLSLYKDENQRLKAELEQLKKLGAGAVAAADPGPAADAAGAVSEAAVGETGEPSPSAPAEKPDSVEDDDVMKEFAAAVSGNSPTPPPLTDDQVATSVPPGASAVPADPQAEIDALLAEAEAEAAAPAAGPAPAPAETAALAGAPPAEEESQDPLAGTLDTSKMLEEVEKLSGDPLDEGDALADSLDTDKLLAEVSELGAGGDSEPIPGEDLFGEFKDEEKKSG